MERTKESLMVEEVAKQGLAFSRKIWDTPYGAAGLLFWAVALTCSLSKTWGIILAFGFGLWFVYKGKKELKK